MEVFSERRIKHVEDKIGLSRNQKLSRLLRALSKKYTWEILVDLADGPKNLTQLSEDNRVPYTTIQNRVAELEFVNVLLVHITVDPATGRPVKLACLDDFHIVLSPQALVEAMEEEVKRPFFLR